jgi:S-adenosylmethionine:tRNA ribosyltransferase-isomerase
MSTILEHAGRVPIPPYIRRARKDDGLAEERFEALDRERYQTVFAREGEAVAAPTAGLHFSQEALTTVRAMGAEVASLRLDVGPGTFAPIRSETLDGHRVAAETFEIPAEASEAIGRTRGRGGRVVAVGTTVVRALESAARPGGLVEPGPGVATLFVKPGHRFAVVDALVTNFHLPKSSLLVLVSAFAGREIVLDAYREAVREGYRFYSYGDAMLFT